MEWNFTHAVDIYYSCPLRQLSFHSARLVSLTDNFCSIYQAASCSINCSLNVEARMENSQCSNTRDGDSIKDVITRAVREPSRRTALSLSLKAVCRRGSLVIKSLIEFKDISPTSSTYLLKSAGRCFQQGGPSRGILWALWKIANVRWQL